MKILLIGLFGTFIVAYCLVFVFFQDKDVSRKSFALISSLIALYFAYHTVKFFIDNRNSKMSTYQKSISFSGYVGIIFIATMPVMLWWGDQHKGWNHFVVSFALYLAFYANILRFIHHNKRFQQLEENKQLEQKYLELKKRLTKREIEIVTCVGQEKSNKEIGELMYISTSTVRKHMSNIYDKAKVSSLEELKEEFPDLSGYFYE